MGFLTSKPIESQNTKKNDTNSKRQSTAIQSELNGEHKNVTEEIFRGCNRSNFNASAANYSRKCYNSSDSVASTLTNTAKQRPLSLSNKFEVMAFTSILVIGVCGNAYVIYLFGYTFKKRTITETMLIYLAFVDLFASLINPLLYIYWISTRYSRWDFGELACKILPPVGPISTTASSAIIMIICIDRYRSIVTPFKNRFTERHVHILCVIAILSSVAFYSYYISALSVSSNGRCVVQSVDSQAYSIPNITITLLCDVTFILVFIPTNIRIFTHLKLSKELQSDVRYWEKRKRANHKVMYMLLTVGVAFALLVFPKDILHITYTMSWEFPPGIAHTTLILSLNSWFKVMQVSNSCVNIFIYSKLHGRFRREMINLFRRLLRRPQLPRIENEITDRRTNISIQYSESARGGMFRRISGKLVQRLSPNPKKRHTTNENGEPCSLTGNPAAKNMTVQYNEKDYENQLLLNGKHDISSQNGLSLERNSTNNNETLLCKQTQLHGQRKVYFDETRFNKNESNICDKESTVQNDNIRKGLKRIDQYAFYKYQNSLNMGMPRKQLLLYDGNRNEACDGKEVARLLEEYEMNGIKSKETSC